MITLRNGLKRNFQVKFEVYFSEHEAYFPVLVMTHLLAHDLIKFLSKLLK